MLCDFQEKKAKEFEKLLTTIVSQTLPESPPVPQSPVPYSRSMNSASAPVSWDPTSTVRRTAVRLNCRLWSHSATRDEASVPAALNANGRVFTSHGCGRAGGGEVFRGIHK